MTPSGCISRIVTGGTVSLGTDTWHADTNVWIVGDENEVVVIDPAHEPDPIIAGVEGRRVTAVVCTHAHPDHGNQAPLVADAFGAPILLHPAEAPLWRTLHPGRRADDMLGHEQVLTAGGISLTVLATPGHSPGSVCLYAPELNAVFTGDTLLRGGPGTPDPASSSSGSIIASIRTSLLPLPGNTTVRPGHGYSSTIGWESQHVEEWIARAN